MSKEHLSPKPIDIDENAWYYEGTSGLEIVIYDRTGGIPRNAKISLARIRSYLKRRDRKRRGG